MIRVTKYRTADGAEYTNRFYAKDHEDSMNKLMRKRGLYKVNNIGLWEECND